jgi:3-oxoacyl-[acyl-carrier protein] reductase
VIRLELSGHRAVVTGASAGIGEAIVTTLAEAGASVAFCARGQVGVTRVCDHARESGLGVHGFVADVSDPVATESFCEAASQALDGPVDILINNVGASVSRNFLRTSDDDWRQLFEANLLSAVRCTRHFLPGMRSLSWGRVVMISSMAARYPSAAIIDYSASKAALIALAKALARKYASDGILINSVLPGRVRTQMWDSAIQEVADATGSSFDEVLAARASEIPAGRYGTPKDIANCVAFLVSDLASYITGTVIDVDGGQGAHII